MKKLPKQIGDPEQVEQAEEFLDKHLAEFDKEKHERALLLLGGVRAVDRIAQSLSSQTMNALIAFQKDDMHEQLGYKRFVDFLDQSDYSPMSKNEFYKRKEIFAAEGVEKYDLFNEARIPLVTRKLIAQASGADITIEGDEILIGDQRADVSDLPLIKSLIKSLAVTNEKFHAGKKAQDEKIEDLRKEIKDGQAQYTELDRSIQAANEGTTYERALTKSIGALINLAVEANKLSLAQTQTRGRGDVEALWAQMLLVRGALQQDDFVFTENTGNSPISDLAKKALVSDDDWNDEDEQ